MVGVEHDVEAVVDDALAAFVGRRDRVAVEEHAERLGKPGVPVRLRHFTARRDERPDIGNARPVGLAALKPVTPAEDRMSVAEADERRANCSSRSSAPAQSYQGTSLSWQ